MEFNQRFGAVLAVAEFAALVIALTLAFWAIDLVCNVLRRAPKADGFLKSPPPPHEVNDAVRGTITQLRQTLGYDEYTAFLAGLSDVVETAKRMAGDDYRVDGRDRPKGTSTT